MRKGFFRYLDPYRNQNLRFGVQGLQVAGVQFLAIQFKLRDPSLACRLFICMRMLWIETMVVAG